MNPTDCLAESGSGDLILPLVVAGLLLVLGALALAWSRRSTTRSTTTVGAVLLIGALLFAPAIAPDPAAADGRSCTKPSAAPSAPPVTEPSATPPACVETLPWDAFTSASVASTTLSVDPADWISTMQAGGVTFALRLEATSATLELVHGDPEGGDLVETPTVTGTAVLVVDPYAPGVAFADAPSGTLFAAAQAAIADFELRNGNFQNRFVITSLVAQGTLTATGPSTCGGNLTRAYTFDASGWRFPLRIV